MRFDFAIGNPPYQENQELTSDTPVYNAFIDAAYDVADKVELITPGRFLFNAGKTPKNWNRKMLSDPHIKVLFYEQNSSRVFSNTDIKGGVVVTYRDRNEDYGAIDVFIQEDILRGVLYKVRGVEGFLPFSSIVNATEHFKLSRTLHEENPNAILNMSSGHEYDLTSNILDKSSQLFHEDKPRDHQKYLQVYGRVNTQRVFRWILERYVKPVEGISDFKVIIPESNNNGTFGETLVNPIVANPGVITTQTFITIGFSKTKNEATAIMKYICTKFVRALLGTLKITQHNKRETWKNIPLQDFSQKSDIDWSVSISHIDKQLYKKYGLTDEEIQFIESRVKEMA